MPPPIGAKVKRKAGEELMTILHHLEQGKSSNVAAIGYTEHEGDSNLELYVRFAGGGEYVYENVPKQVVIDFLDADSKGKFLAENIKGKYQYHKV